MNISHFSVIDQNHIRKRGKKQEKTLEKHFLQFTVRKNNFFKLLRKKKIFKLLWKKIGFESFCRTLRQQLRSRNEKNGLFQLTGESRPPLEWKSPLLRYKYKAQLKPSCTSSLHSTLLWLSPLTWTSRVRFPASAMELFQSLQTFFL